LARATQTPANPDLGVPLIVRLLEPPSVTDDRPIATQRASPGQQRKRDLSHPGAVLSSASGSAIKRINGWREGPPVTVSRQSFDLLAGPSPSRQKSAPNEKKNTPLRRGPRAPQIRTLAGLKRLRGQVD
jgi:hypothetical protein